MKKVIGIKKGKVTNEGRIFERQDDGFWKFTNWLEWQKERGISISTSIRMKDEQIKKEIELGYLKIVE